MENNKGIIFGVSLTGALVLAYFVYRAINEYQMGKRIQNMDENLAKLAGGESYSNKLLDKITLKETTKKIGDKINNNL